MSYEPMDEEEFNENEIPISLTVIKNRALPVFAARWAMIIMGLVIIFNMNTILRVEPDGKATFTELHLARVIWMTALLSLGFTILCMLDVIHECSFGITKRHDHMNYANGGCLYLLVVSLVFFRMIVKTVAIASMPIILEEVFHIDLNGVYHPEAQEALKQCYTFVMILIVSVTTD